MKKNIMFTTILWVMAAFNMATAAEYKLMEWKNLIPKDAFAQMALEKSKMGQVDHEGNLTLSQAGFGPVDVSLDGQDIKIAGFVVPLDGTDTHVSEFLLVPYFGACTHLPPPPANQIIYVKADPAVPIDDLMDAVWVSGKLTAKQINYEGIEVGYKMTLGHAEAYQISE
jgi:hypothetical protein